MNDVDILILGAGWTSDFLIPLLRENSISFAATTRDGRARSNYNTIKFQFDPESDDATSFRHLPEAQTVIITFPIYKSGASERLVNLWKQTHSDTKAAFLQLGSTGIWNGDRTLKREESEIFWYDRNSAFDPTNERAQAEVELLKLAPDTPTTVLDLSGLWGGQRNPRNWVDRIAPTKEVLSRKGSLHLIHGLDVARGILAVHRDFRLATGQRWLLTDCRVYDVWDLVSAWGGADTTNYLSVSSGNAAPPTSQISSTVSYCAHAQHSVTEPLLQIVTSPQPSWVRALMVENGVRALPRPPSALGNALDSREFWDTFGISPAKTLLAT
ncbi:hypothetical protein EW145_g3463 [Phellinidium pouzarii]|uniref:Uncharacterized protein n=1 Tax=Phellinidium pouzarii TaxID=167371 RepID=A0A4S4L8J1_9AGAM|nr:hypothetical protein EW145_g3463 [Phellinidium pouzarii]